MTLHEVFRLLEDGGKLIKMESGEKTSKKATGRSSTKELMRMAQARGIKLPSKGL